MNETSASEALDQKDIDLASIGSDTSDNPTSDTLAKRGELQQFVSFRIGSEEYGIEIMAVREIKGWVEVTPLPNSPEYMLGVLNLRGVIVPIFDMRCRFGMGKTEATPLHVMIIVAVGDRVMGVLVDAVSDILTVGAHEVLEVPELDQRGDRKFLCGLVTHEERMVALLSLDKLFDLGAIVDQMAS